MKLKIISFLFLLGVSGAVLADLTIGEDGMIRCTDGCVIYGEGLMAELAGAPRLVCDGDNGPCIETERKIYEGDEDELPKKNSEDKEEP